MPRAAPRHGIVLASIIASAVTDFFRRRLGASQTLVELMALRGQYRQSFGFVLGCLPMLVRLHVRTARDNRFPREVVRGR